MGGHQAVSAFDDAGVSWTRVSSFDDAAAMGWAFAQDATYVSGHPGLNRSDDRAATFRRINAGLPAPACRPSAPVPAPSTATPQTAAAFASTDGGRTWEARAANKGEALFTRIVVDPDEETHLLDADAQAGVAESRDGGRSWARLDTGLRGVTWPSRGGARLAVLVASGPAGAARSTDGGRTWSHLTVPQGASLIEVAPEDPNALYAGSHTGSAVRVPLSRASGATGTTPSPPHSPDAEAA